MVLIIAIILFVLLHLIETELRSRRTPQTTVENCPRCNREVTGEHLLCPDCKTLLRKHCKGCGRSRSVQHRYCPICGLDSQTEASHV